MSADAFHDAITDVPGTRVGHAHDLDALTGVTVVLCEQGAAAGIDQRGGAPGTRQTDGLRPLHLVQQAHAVVLAGGSAFGLDAASGVVRYLEERGIGLDVRVARVPIVPSAILFDLNVGRADVRPDAAMGYAACRNASRERPAEGCVGAGAGATVGKILGIRQATKSGLGTASVALSGGVIVGAIVAVNAFGDVVELATGQILAGARRVAPAAVDAADAAPGAPHFADTLAVMRDLAGRPAPGFARSGENTVIGVVATNARFGKEEVNRVAQMAHDGLARAVRPAHTLVDGDTLFALATGQVSADVNVVGAYAAEVLARAIVRAVLCAQPAGGLPANLSFRGYRAEQVVVRGYRPEQGEADALRPIVDSLSGWFTPDAWDEIRSDLETAPALVAEIDGKLVGFVCWRRSKHAEPGLVELLWLAVHRDWRGRGVGRALVLSMEDRLRAQGDVRAVEVCTVADSELYPPYVATRAFYRALGFRDAYVDTVNQTPDSGELLYLRKDVTPVASAPDHGEL